MYRIIIFQLLLCFIFGELAWSQAALPQARIGGISINADEFYRDSELGYIELKGNVQLVYKNQHISAQRAKIHYLTQKIEASGNVSIVTPKATIGGSGILFDYESNTGIIYDGFVQSGPVIFQGSVLHKTGEDEYVATEANYTTCSTCPAAWDFSGSEIKAEMGGYAHIQNSFLKVGGIPIFWLPYLIVPLKSDRQTGLLTPEINISGQGGLTISQSLFWAMSESTDSTWTLKNYEKRGLKGLLNYRYMLSENSYGEFDTALIRDRVFADDFRLNKFRDPDDQKQLINRWFLKYSHYYDLPDGLIQRTQLNLASDLQYPQDFPKETMNHGDPTMENRASFTKNFENIHASLDSSYYVNLLQEDPKGNNNDAVHRFPELRMATTQTPILDDTFVFDFDLNFVNFARDGLAYDNLTTCTDTNGKTYRCIDRVSDGVFDEGTDIIRTGQRFDFKPTISKPIQLGSYIDLLPKISYRETQYNFAVGENSNNYRRLIRTEISAKSTATALFGDVDHLQGTIYKHEIQPEVIATNVPWIDHPSHPFFGFSPQTESPFFSRDNVGDADLNGDYGLQFDYNDRLYDRNLVTFVVNNKWTQKKWLGGLPDYKQLASFKVSRTYDAYQESEGNDPWSDITSILDLRFDHFQSYTISNYFPNYGIANTSSRVRFIDKSQNFFQVQLVKQYALTSDKKIDFNNQTEDYTFALGFNAKYIDLVGKFTYDANWKKTEEARKIKSWAYIAQFKPPGDCWFINFTHDQIIGGDTNFNLSFEFVFDGIKKNSLSPSSLDTFSF